MTGGEAVERVCALKAEIKEREEELAEYLNTPLL